MSLDRLSAQAIRRRLASPDFMHPAWVWVLTRAFFVLMTYFGVILFNNALHSATHPSFFHQLLPAWNNPISHGGWDTQWYLDIAQRGYNWKRAVGTSPTAFFPLYPMLIRAGVLVAHRSYIGTALIVSNACFFGALVYLWRLVAWEVGETVAARTTLYIAVFPTALFFFAGYTESLFLLLTVASFYHLRRHEWIVAGSFGGLASATRVTGVLLMLPFIYEYARSRDFASWKPDRGLLGLILVPAGLVAFMAYLAATVGDAWAFTHSQEAWQKIFTPWLWQGFAESFRQLFDVQPAASFFGAHNLINIGIGGLFLVWSFFAARKLPGAYGVYLGAFWLVTLSSPAMANGYPVPLISLSRYVLILFPVFMYLGILGERERFHNGYLVIATGLLALFTLQFVNGGWII
jgi:hypothetical protein